MKWKEIFLAAAISVFASVIVTHAVSPPFAESWSPAYEAIPADTESESLGASRIRDLKQQIRLRLSQDLSWKGDGNDGYSNQVTLLQQTTDCIPAFDASATGGCLYTKAVGNNSELFYRDPLRNVVQITNQGILNLPTTPTGMVAWTAGAIPTGWLACDGSSQSTAAFPALFSSISYIYGGSGANFNLPDVRGRTIFSLDIGDATGRLSLQVAGGLAANALGNGGGAQSETLTAAMIPTITSTASPTLTGNATSAVGNIVSYTGSPTDHTGSGANNVQGVSALAVSVSGTVSSTSSNTGGGLHNVVPPGIILQCMIKT